MKKTILVVAAVAGLALTAVGQSEMKQEPKKSNTVTSPRDAASGQASGKRATYDVKKSEGSVQEDQQQASEKKGNYDVKKMEGAAQEDPQASSKKSDGWNLKEGKGSATDDWQTQTARDAQSGKATGKMENVSAPADNTVKSPRDVSTGMATGKRQHPAVAPNDPPKK